MPIEIHCPACSRGIRAPDDAGGKTGKCPYCGVSVYIPMPASESGDIPLAPVDPQVERQREKLRQEAVQYAAEVDHEQGGKYDVSPSPRGARGAGAGKPPPAPREEPIIDIPEQVKRFVLAMRDSDLAGAERIVARLKRRKDQTTEYVQGMLLDQMGLRIDRVPQALVNGFLKNLLERLE